MDTREKVSDWLKLHDIENYIINEDLSVDVDGDVKFGHKGILSLPLKFGRVSGAFDLAGNELISLRGCPDYVGGYFNCWGRKLTTLEGWPKYVGGKSYGKYDHWDNISSMGGLILELLKQEHLFYCQTFSMNEAFMAPIILRQKICDVCGEDVEEDIHREEFVEFIENNLTEQHHYYSNNGMDSQFMHPNKIMINFKNLLKMKRDDAFNAVKYHSNNLLKLKLDKEFPKKEKQNLKKI